jgi:UDP-N-acetylglucosamine acyltransferase
VPPVNIHPLAIVSPQAQLGIDVAIGPFAVIEADVVISDRCRIASHAVIKDGTQLGADNEVCEAAVLGGHPQHIKKPTDLGRLIIGDGNTFREHVTVHRAMKPDSATQIGNQCMIMASGHVGHDCRLGNNIVVANGVMLGGHVVVEDRAFVSGNVGVHQFCRIGQLAIVGGMARVIQDVPPYVMVDGQTGCVVGLNLVGLRRAGFTTDQVAELKRAYRVIYRRGLKWREVLEALKNEFVSGPAAAFLPFLSAGTRGFVQERRMPPGATIKLRPTEGAPEGEESPVALLPELRAKAG